MPSVRPPSRRRWLARRRSGLAGRPGLPRRSGRARRSGLARRSRRRLFGVLATFGIAFALITYKLVSIQGLDSTSLQRVTDAYMIDHVLPDLRGSILAANGDELALSQMRPTIFADPNQMDLLAATNKIPAHDQQAAEAARIAPVLHLKVAALRADFAERTGYVVLAADQSDAVAAEVGKLQLPGIVAESEPVRIHPDGDLASAIIGGVDSLGGYSGLEHEYDKVLSGRPGKLVESIDENNHAIAGSISEDRPAVNGDDVLTTINEALQYQTEQVLLKAVAAARGKAGTAIIMDTATGDLLAVASVVASRKGPVAAPSAQAFTNVYEPGSVGKIVTLSAGLAQHVITPSSRFTIPDAYLAGGVYFHDAEDHPTEGLTATGILAQSSNIGAIQVGQRLGAKRLYGYEQAYGMTQRTAVNFPGEAPGVVTPLSQFSDTTLPTLAFGEDDAVTATQMIAAVNTVANGGVYVPPRLVTATVGADGKEHTTATPAPHRVIPASIATEVTGMLEQVVSTGTGTAAKIGSYAVAGKTGTGYIYSHGVQIPGQYVSSFAGFAPAQKPAVTVMVVIDDTPEYGAQASAGPYAQLTTDALLDLGISTAGPQPAPSVAAIPTLDGKPELYLLGG